MYKIANQVLDAYDDTSKTILKKIASKNGNINMISDGERSALQDDDFALSVITKKASKLNKFPIDSHDSTWISNEFFNETFANLPLEAQGVAAYNIKMACNRFGVQPTPAVEGLAKEASSNLFFEGDVASKNIRVIEEDMGKYAQVQKICDNETFAQYTFGTTENVKTGCEYFKQYSDKMPLELRHKYASAIQRRAGDLGMTITDPAIRKYASSSYNAHLDAHLASRKDLLQIKEPMFTEGLAKLASMRNTLNPSEFAQVLHGFDKRAGLDKYYGGYLTNPYEATFASIVNPDLVKLSSSNSMTPDALKKLFIDKYAKVKEYFGSSIADSLKKEGSAAFDALPDDAKEIISGIADGSL